MKTIKNQTKKYIVLLILLLLNACTITDPITNNNRDVIDQALQDGLKNNRILSSKNKNLLHLSPALQKALLPGINIPNPPPNSKFAEEIDPTFDIAVNNVPAKDFFMGLVKDTKYNIAISPQISGNISLELKSATIPQTMEAVRDIYGFEYEKTAYGYKVFPRRLETRIFHINYLDLNRNGQSQTTIGSGQITSTVQSTLTSSGISNQQQTGSIPSGIIHTSSNSKFWDLLKTNLETIIGTQDGRSVVINHNSGAVIVKAYPDELRAVAQYLDKIQNIIHRQVIIEAKILEVQLNAHFQSGINWKLLGLQQGYPESTNTATTISDTSSVSSGTLANNGSPDLPTFAGILNIKSQSGNAFKSVINLLNTQGNVNILSSPRIATINNQKAVIKVGNDKFFVTNVSSNTNNSSTTTSNTTANITLTPFFSGISLDVTPQIDENDYITIHIHPIISKVTQDKQTFYVNGQLQQLPLAASTVRESDSVVRAKSGQVVVIGGLITSSGEDYQASTPGADNLPAVNGLFKNKNKIAGKFELVILLRPMIAESTSTWQQQLQEAATNVKKMREDFSYKVVPTRKRA